MSEIIFVPITCPRCSTVSQVPYTRQEMIEISRTLASPTLHSQCHNISWTASDAERKAIHAIAAKACIARVFRPSSPQPELWEARTPARISGSAEAAFFSFLPTKAANNTQKIP